MAAGLICLSGCSTTRSEPTLDQRFCGALKEWVDAGPRESTTGRFLEISAGNPVGGFMWSMDSRDGCDGEDCRDPADRDFTRELAPMTHYWWIADFTEKASRVFAGLRE